MKFEATTEETKRYFNTKAEKDDRVVQAGGAGVDAGGNENAASSVDAGGSDAAAATEEKEAAA